VNDPRRYEQHLAGIGERIKKSANPNIKLYVSEWNLTHGAWGNDWRVGLYAGGILNALERQSNLVIMSCPALWMRRTWATAWNNALINFDQNRWFPAGNYVVMKLFRDSYAPKLLAMDGPQKPLNLTATRSENGDTVYLKLVNPEKTPVDAEFSFDGSFTASSTSMQLVAPGEETAKNSLDHPDVIKPVAAQVQRGGNKIRVSLPPLSVGVVSVVK
jgi:alpha-N-arabinofuranosidase